MVFGIGAGMIGLLIGIFGGLLFFLLKSKFSQSQTQELLIQKTLDSFRSEVRLSLDGNAQVVQQQLVGILKQVGDQLHQTRQDIGGRLEGTARVVGEVQNKLGKLEESNRQIFEVGKDIARLQEILRAPKLRGGLGEFFLGDLLSQIIPPEYYQLQYGFKSGAKVDAVIRLGGRHLVSVDSKFPLENFLKGLSASSDLEKKTYRKQFLTDVKKHIDAIASKYISLDEGTFDFALMYIPAENVYYETIIKDDTSETSHSLFHYALEKRVIPVSPNSFYAYLQVILLGLKGMKIEDKALETLGQLHRLADEFGKFKEDFDRVGAHLSNASGSFEKAEKHMGKFEEKLLQVDALEGTGVKELV
ncbi:MAG: DNA recombination protein RmuC [Chlamydiae bacterium]|nr:DNA recombination protein RmuC [Chlamydiota bacterium]MBI3277290.1 DNA recombination protein RmuC [Chlamydiota bacterium]